ncbi:hypothetical protein CTAYLR_009818 [Chrysophaeum taylorii]|uniref:Uncharacterized protein n=1 Tax=Chrysophaeum taylorii TaxID=2483200 RepID=A0AAD7XI60_9STRA|nr:hypothetical protein CTAYLR_009818 [Chrysophaeum taylorii]
MNRPKHWPWLVLAVAAASEAACTDGNNMCAYWAGLGECGNNPDYMLTVCASSCNACNTDVQVDATGEVEVVEEAKNPRAVAPTSDGGGVVHVVSHELSGTGPVEVVWLDDGKASGKKEVVMFTLRPRESMRMNTFSNHVFSIRSEGQEVARFRVMPDRPRTVLTRKVVEMYAGPACLDKQPSCAQRAARGECASSPGWMVMMCSASCDSCHLRDPELRCARSALNMAQGSALKPGELDAKFVAAATEGAYDVTVHSGPRAAFPDVAGNASRDGPWVLTFENFVTDAEADAIVASVKNSFSRSTDQGSVDEFGEQQKVVSQGRTSENAWCTGTCEDSPSTLAVMKRIEGVTGIPTANYESFQVLRYLPGQYYRSHHDMSGADNNLACGPRIYTFFLYLSDVEEGGETEFPLLEDDGGVPLRIRPRRGSALWWPSVRSDDPTRQDPRTCVTLHVFGHAALQVKTGIKFAANAWIHLFDYRVPNHWGCTGSFD